MCVWSTPQVREERRYSSALKQEVPFLRVALWSAFASVEASWPLHMFLEQEVESFAKLVEECVQYSEECGCEGRLVHSARSLACSSQGAHAVVRSCGGHFLFGGFDECKA